MTPQRGDQAVHPYALLAPDTYHVWCRHTSFRSMSSCRLDSKSLPNGFSTMTRVQPVLHAYRVITTPVAVRLILALPSCIKQLVAQVPSVSSAAQRSHTGEKAMEIN